ncbi:MAG: hypothetical protein U9Q83_08235, partial [Bacteroidota bacterium]|nr:hypothetical protein [Bacteroidota bacterium]
MVSFISAFGIREQEKVKTAAAKRLKEIEENLKLYGEEDQFYQEINNIPAHMIAEKLLPEFKF